MTTDDGYRFAQSAVNKSDKHNMVMIWSAIPCTGGSPWQNINKFLPVGEERIKSHLKIFRSLWKRLTTFVDWIHSTGRKWRICVEWPKGCAYWNWKEVRVFLTKWNLQDICFDGCAIGLKGRSGELLKKPWRVCTNDQHILCALRNLTCSNTGNVLTDHVHAECRGIDCKDSEKYTFVIHKQGSQSIHEHYSR